MGVISSNPLVSQKNPTEIFWYYLSLNYNAIHLLEQNQDKIYWKYLLRNPNALHLIRLIGRFYQQMNQYLN